MENNKVIKCEICGRPLSSYNRSKVCYSHNTHPEYDDKKVNDHCSKLKGDCSSHTPEGILKSDMAYYGELRDWIGRGFKVEEIEFPERDLCNLFK